VLRVFSVSCSIRIYVLYWACRTSWWFWEYVMSLREVVESVWARFRRRVRCSFCSSTFVMDFL